jgi:2-hydroxychromene-2-carboxylate isomerase
MEDKNISDRKTLQTLINKQGIDGESLIASAENETTAAFISYTEEAIDRGVFGLPSYLTKWDIFWGQDRLDFLDLSLTERT